MPPTASQTPSLIRVDPEIMGGKPCIAGTRITVELVLENLAAGHSLQDLLSWYPQLSEEGLRAAVQYALDVMRHEEVQWVRAAG